MPRFGTGMDSSGKCQSGWLYLAWAFESGIDVLSFDESAERTAGQCGGAEVSASVFA
jgi:hypothetical protein